MEDFTDNGKKPARISDLLRVISGQKTFSWKKREGQIIYFVVCTTFQISSVISG